MKLLTFILAGLISGAAALSAAESETMAARTLRQLVEQQKALFAEAAKNPAIDDETFRAQLQDVSHGFERLLQENPKFAEAYAAYGYLLGKIDMRKESRAMLLKANE